MFVSKQTHVWQKRLTCRLKGTYTCNTSPELLLQTAHQKGTHLENWFRIRYLDHHKMWYETCCNTLQHAVTHCSTLQHTVRARRGAITLTIGLRSNKQTITRYCLKNTPTCCNMLPHDAPRCNTPLRYAVIRCDTLQHAATRCRTGHTGDVPW